MENSVPETGEKISAFFRPFAQGAIREAIEAAGIPAPKESPEAYFQADARQLEEIPGGKKRMEVHSIKSAVPSYRDAKPGHTPHMGTDRRTALYVKIMVRRLAKFTRLDS